MGGKLPVMVWIHWGGLSNGHGNVASELLAEKGVVVVSLNYKLGPLGFLRIKSMRVRIGILDFKIKYLRYVGSPEKSSVSAAILRE